MSDLKEQGLSKLILFGAPMHDDRPTTNTITLPGPARVRVAGHLVEIPRGECKVIGPCDLDDYDVVH